MADWKVSREVIELKPHYNADSLELAKVGNRQFVVRKGTYQNGDIVIAIPEKSILPNELIEPFLNYLRKGNIVGSTKLRGELSQGVLVPDLPDLGELGEDISKKLGIEYYEPPIPSSMAGNVKPQRFSFYKHDCDPLGINSESLEGKTVFITEKLHGSQINISARNGLFEVTSKGLGKKGLVLEESSSNLYWQAFRRSGLENILESYFDYGDLVQIIGEVIPCQKGFSYGMKTPVIKIFKILHNGMVLRFDQIPDVLARFLVPVLYIGEFDMRVVSDLANKGKSQIDGVTTKEGVVVSDVTDPHLTLKFISDEYSKKSTGEEFN